jgi:hypothetical protein
MGDARYQLIFGSFRIPFLFHQLFELLGHEIDIPGQFSQFIRRSLGNLDVFSNLYPTPQTVLMNNGLPGSSSIFPLILRIWTITVLLDSK